MDNVTHLDLSFGTSAKVDTANALHCLETPDDPPVQPPPTRYLIEDFNEIFLSELLMLLFNLFLSVSYQKVD